MRKVQTRNKVIIFVITEVLNIRRIPTRSRPHYTSLRATDIHQMKYIVFFYQQIMAHSNEMYNVKCWFIYVSFLPK